MEFRSKVLECLGKFPEPAALEPEIVSTEDKGSHLLQLVRYSTEKDERINAYLLLPKNMAGACPAIIACHQHNGQYYLGKSEPAGLSSDSMYHYGLELCLRGYIVLCPDHLCFEDRRPAEIERVENDHLQGPNYEMFMFTKYILQGSTLQAKYLFDLCRAVDFLESVPQVDKNRIGAIGHSLGGQEALWLAWYDKRIKAAASSCGFSQINTILKEKIRHNFSMYSFGFLKVGDMVDLVKGLDGRPFMMTAGTGDIHFPIEGVREIVAGAEERYAEIGKSENFKAIIFEGEHMFPEEVRKDTYEWLDNFLKK